MEQNTNRTKLKNAKIQLYCYLSQIANLVPPVMFLDSRSSITSTLTWTPCVGCSCSLTLADYFL